MSEETVGAAQAPQLPCPKADGNYPWEHGPAEAPHPCPFAHEIHDDDSLCECCVRCQHECAMDI